MAHIIGYTTSGPMFSVEADYSIQTIGITDEERDARLKSVSKLDRHKPKSADLAAVYFGESFKYFDITCITILKNAGILEYRNNLTFLSRYKDILISGFCDEFEVTTKQAECMFNTVMAI